MKVAIVGFPYSGKTTLFTAISGVPRDHVRAAEEVLASVKVPEPRLDWLEEIYKPKKRTEALMDFLDLPGSTDGETQHAGLSRHMPTLRQADALLAVLRGFKSDSVTAHRNRIDPAGDLTEIREEMLLTDMLICDSRIEKLEASIPKANKDRDKLKHELAVLQRCREALRDEKPLTTVVQPGEEDRMLKSFGFLTQKPLIAAINVNEEKAGAAPPFTDPHAFATIAVCATIEAEIIQIEPPDRPEFMAGYGISALARDRIIRACYDALNMIAFLTCGEDEVRAWPIPRGATAVEAAGKIHSDLARGFIKAETIHYEELRAAGSMREAKAHNKMRMESKGYVVQDGDIMNIKFNVS